MKLTPVDYDPFAQESTSGGPVKFKPVDYDPFAGIAGANAPNWADVPMAALKNAPSSALELAKGLASAVAHPIDTAKGAIDAAAGGLRNIVPSRIREGIDALDWNPQAAQNASEVASGVADIYKNRYGSEEGVRKTLATDPVGALADASMLVGGGASLASKGAQLANLPRAAKVAESVASAASRANPISLGIGAVKTGGKLAGNVAANVLGLTTGAGADAVKGAVTAGARRDPSFMQSLSGDGGMDDVLTQAKQALESMRAKRSSAYVSGIATTAADTKPLNFSSIDAVLNNSINTLKEGKHWKVGKDELGKVKEVQKIVEEWRSDPKAHSAIGLDALKQRLDAVYPDSPSQAQAQRVITTVRNAVKDSIVKQSPEYAKTMEAYEESIKLEREISKALSLGSKSAAETAMRKLQSLTRNNANTNYGYRKQLANALQTEGGVDLMPSLSGQALSSWTPRNLAGQGAGLATIGAAISHPAIAAILPMQSPKAVGLMGYGAGRVGNALGGLMDNVPIDPERAKWAALLAAQLENQQ